MWTNLCWQNCQMWNFTSLEIYIFTRNSSEGIQVKFTWKHHIILREFHVNITWTFSREFQIVYVRCVKQSMINVKGCQVETVSTGGVAPVVGRRNMMGMSYADRYRRALPREEYCAKCCTGTNCNRDLCTSRQGKWQRLHYSWTLYIRHDVYTLAFVIVWCACVIKKIL